MSRKSKIRWRDSDTQKLEKQIEKFNAKIYRTRYNHPESKDILPNTIKKADKQQMIEEFKNKSRSEFNNYLKSLDRFTQKGAEKPVYAVERVVKGKHKKIVTKELKEGDIVNNKVTNWEKKEVAINVAKINRQRNKEMKKVKETGATSRGEKLDLKRGEMGSERLNELKPKKFNFAIIRGGKEWEKFKANVEKQANPVSHTELMEQYKQNYLKGLDEYGGQADHIKAIVEQLPAEVVVETYYREQEATIKFYYEGIEGLQDKDTVISIIGDIWTNALNEYNSLHR